MMLGLLTGAICGFITATFFHGGPRRVLLSFAICGTGVVVDAIPRRRLPDWFVRWHHNMLDAWEPR